MDQLYGLSTRVPGEPGTAVVDTSLKFLQPVSRQLVHRAAVAEVFITDALPVSESRFLVGAQWPRDHALYYPDAQGVSDPLLLTETVRQALVYLGHEYCGIPLGHRFVGSDTHFEITDHEALAVGDTPLHVTLDVQWSWVANRPPRRFGMQVDVVVSVAGRACARAGLSVYAVDERLYRRLRWRGNEEPGGGGAVPAGHTAATRLPAAEVGRLRAKDSVLGRTETGEWRLLVDLHHAVLFDHPGDHIPLMVTLEGARQLGHRLVSHCHGAPVGAAVLRAVRMDCPAFADLDEPVRLCAELRPRGTAPDLTRMRVTAVQREETVATVTMEWLLRTRPAAPGGITFSRGAVGSGAAV
ncbi:ScbA/BarX family gamma-butyrolactone biosynthesis protein (plasmid) [Streptomyces castrisilvae]|uniref:ScbA/BarX family gamma-butyrolactone biosynthesis protein n=1 Tax=Streptomyces castrisilvae TaxID=3033811 RepID=A0ABY9HYB8_9ACTN|nr:ScbA/BarX family gamma-butyrolactone biosynthesis protein [Streptomyces sp. Mut1]WLQ38416.1 ScbA/BarX family gamma-butyrolactone biosynthesis protein [Streptomyces sp. Mut1]